MTNLAFIGIPLSRGLYALVDGEDYERLKRWKWYADKGGHTFYAVRKTGSYLCRKTIPMHQMILNIPKGLEADHINHNGLDNRKQNLRICTRKQNQQNQQKVKYKCTSKYKGVYWHKTAKKWYAQIKCDGKENYLGSFGNEEEAAKAYDKAAKRLFGEFASTNLRKEN